MSGKFFMYGALPMHLLNGIVWLYETVKAPLVLTTFQDQVTYMVMGRAISAALGTATVLVVYFVGKRVSNAFGGGVAAALLATTVVHIAESHSFRVDLAMIFFASVTWLFALRIADSGRLRTTCWRRLCRRRDRIELTPGVHRWRDRGGTPRCAGTAARGSDRRGWVDWTVRGSARSSSAR